MLKKAQSQHLLMLSSLKVSLIGCKVASEYLVLYDTL